MAKRNVQKNLNADYAAGKKTGHGLPPVSQLPGTPNRIELLSLLHPLMEMLEQPNFSPGLTSWHILYERRVEALLKFFESATPDNPDKRPVPPAISTGFYKSVFEVLKVRYPEAVKKWDHNDYAVFGPMSLDDEAKVVVSLRSKTGDHDIVLAL